MSENSLNTRDMPRKTSGDKQQPRPLPPLVASHPEQKAGRTDPKAEATQISDNITRVEWNDPHDPENPRNWHLWKKVGTTIMIILHTLNVTFSSSALTPTVNAIANEFEVSSQVAVLITSSFLIGYFFGPMVWPGLSEIIGRRNVYLFSITAYTLLSLGQALGKNIQTVLITRFLSGLFGSSPLTNGSGVIADVWDAVGRGRAMSVFVASVFLGPILGPIMGAFVVANDSMGWRWTVWILVIISGTVSVASVFLLPETFAPFLLVQKARRLRKLDPVKNAAMRADLELQKRTFRSALDKTVFRPYIMLAQEPILFLITIYLGLLYGLLYALFQVFPIIFVEIRSIHPKLAGLTFIGLGIGTTIGAIIFYYQTKSYPELAKMWRGHPPPEARLPGAMIGAPLLVASILAVCWTGAYQQIPWYVPEIMAIPLGVSLAILFIAFQSYLVDTYLMYSASAMAANAMIRAATGAAFPLFTDQMFRKLGVGWAGTVIAGVALLLAPSPFVFAQYGARIRAKSEFAPCLDLKIRDEVQRVEMESKNLEKTAVG